MSQLCLFDTEIEVKDSKISRNSSNFIDNMKLPIHRWFRYSAGFSAEWVKEVLKTYAKDDSYIIDPFAGSGTTLVAANELGIPSLGFEKHYFIRRIANIKLNYNIDLNKINRLSSFIANTESEINFNYEEQPELLKKCYSEDILYKLNQLKYNYLECNDNTHEAEIIWLAITSILRCTSHAGTAQWQYILPNKKKKNVIEPQFAFLQKISEIVNDLILFQGKNIKSNGIIIDHDARENNNDFLNKFDILITSPPYPNNYDYADSTRLELLFWQEINGWADLQLKIREGLVRSCSQHTAAQKLQLENILNNELLTPVYDEIKQVCLELEKIRMEHGGKKTYHTMIGAYYLDLAKVFVSLRLQMKEGSIMCFVIGDSAPYGIYAPADIWLSKLALSAGFKECTFEKIRDRNIKWKNRKHRVPLKEGRLWIKG
jgi:DNA modification methylase